MQYKFKDFCHFSVNGFILTNFHRFSLIFCTRIFSVSLNENYNIFEICYSKKVKKSVLQAFFRYGAKNKLLLKLNFTYWECFLSLYNKFIYMTFLIFLELSPNYHYYFINKSLKPKICHVGGAKFQKKYFQQSSSWFYV